MKFSNFALFGAATAMANPMMNYLLIDEMLDDSSDSSDSLMKLMLLSPGLLGKFFDLYTKHFCSLF